MQKATRQQIKEHNKRLVLKTIYHQADISRADIARATRLTRTTVSDIVGDLMADGLLQESGVGVSEGGKPPILLNLVGDARELVSIDLSGDEFRGALVNLRGEIIQRAQVNADCQDDQSSLECVYSLLDQLVGYANAPLLGIGIGSPGLIDSSRGIIRRAVNLGWKDLQLQQLLAVRYGAPIYIANDSHIAALAEHVFGKMRYQSNLVVIKAGPGIGSGIVLDGQIFYGDSFSSGEIGHLSVVEDGIQCRCGNFGCLETVASTRAIINRVRESVGQQDGNSMGSILEAYNNGNQAVREIILEAGHYLGISVANLAGILNVQNIVISGYLVEFGDGVLSEIRECVDQRLLSALARETKVEFSELGSDNVILGASALVLAEEFGLP